MAVSAARAIASAGYRYPTMLRQPMQCFEEVRAAACRERATVLTMAGLEPSEVSGPSNMALDPARLCCPQC